MEPDLSSRNQIWSGVWVVMCCYSVGGFVGWQPVSVFGGFLVGVFMGVVVGTGVVRCGLTGFGFFVSCVGFGVRV